MKVGEAQDIHPWARTLGPGGHVMDGLVERCRERDETAWRELYDAHFEFVHRVAFRLGTPASELDDVVQDVFTIAYRRLDQFEGGRFTTWLYRICANVVSARHRHRRVRRVFAALLPWVAAPSPTEAPGRALERDETSRSVQLILERMAPKKREVLVLFELEALPAREIAERLGCPEATVFTRLHHARREFKDLARRLGLSPGETP
jgi:RNA polymerase sigma-70 factor (ECF subfamily)